MRALGEPGEVPRHGHAGGGRAAAPRRAAAPEGCPGVEERATGSCAAGKRTERRRGAPGADGETGPGPAAPHRSGGARAAAKGPARRLLTVPRSRQTARRHFDSAPSSAGSAATGSPPAPSPGGAPGEAGGSGAHTPRSTQPSPACRTHHLAAAVACQRGSPRSASPTAPRLREGAGPTVGTSPASPRPPSYCQSPQRNSLPPPPPSSRWGTGLPRQPRLQGNGSCYWPSPNAQPPRTAAIGGAVATAPGLSRPPPPQAPPTGACEVAAAAEPFPSALRGWREAEAGGEAEPRFQTTARGPRRVWAPGHGLRREQVQTWPRCSPRGAARSGRRPPPGRGAPPSPAGPGRSLPSGAASLRAGGAPGANRCRPALAAFPPTPPVRPPRGGVPGLMTPLARPVAFPVWARPRSPGCRRRRTGKLLPRGEGKG